MYVYRRQSKTNRSGFNFRRETIEIKRRTEILIETTRQIVVRDSGSSERFTCPQCGETMLAAEHAALVFGSRRRAAYQFIERQNAHFVETEAGAVMLCLPSLTAILQASDAEQLPDDERIF